MSNQVSVAPAQNSPTLHHFANVYPNSNSPIQSDDLLLSVTSFNRPLFKGQGRSMQQHHKSSCCCGKGGSSSNLLWQLVMLAVGLFLFNDVFEQLLNRDLDGDGSVGRSLEEANQGIVNRARIPKGRTVSFGGQLTVCPVYSYCVHSH